MTDIIKITAWGMLGTFLTLVLKEHKPHMALCVGLLTGVGICLILVPHLSALVSFVKRLYASVGGEDSYFQALMKVTGISMLSKIASDVCKDAGQQAVASTVSMAGRILCVCLCLPQVAAIFTLLTSLIPTG